MPSVTVFESHANVYGEVVSVLLTTLSTKNSTLFTPVPPLLSVLEAVMVVVPIIVAPLAGAVIDTEGGMPSTNVTVEIAELFVLL